MTDENEITDISADYSFSEDALTIIVQLTKTGQYYPMEAKVKIPLNYIAESLVPYLKDSDHQ